MKRIIWFYFLIGCCINASVFAQQVTVAPNLQTGAIDALTVHGDKSGMNWILKTDGSQYAWIKENYGWGLGYFTETLERESMKREWKTPSEISAGGMEATYREGNILIRVKRQPEQNDLVETYTFINEGSDAVYLSDIGIYTPFNDNYPDAVTCINTRTHAHIWEGGTAAYVNALRMGNYAPHLGLVVTGGSVKSYEIWERGHRKGNSHYRGVITLNPPNTLLKAGETCSIAWRLFSHSGSEDFRNKLLDLGSVLASCNKYIFEKGETARVEFRSKQPLKNCSIKKNGVPLPTEYEGDVWFAETLMEQAGEVRFDFCYGEGKQTHAACLVFGSIDSLIEKRTRFIRDRQQMNNPADLRDGAYMVYDNETDKIYLNDTPNANPVDRDEGAERVGMGILLAKQYLLTQDTALKSSLTRYAKFLREKLQTGDYVTYSSVDQKGRIRGYNYMWVASFYFEMYKVTGDRQYAEDGYQTLQAMFRRFGYGFYAIEIPVLSSLQSLKKAGMKSEYDDLKDDFFKTGDIFIQNGLNYPKHEVNYEQSIVAPAVTFLTQLYLETGIQKYLDEARHQLPVLEAFNGFQSSYHLNDIAIRHWDGYWFGKREMFGDIYPHYWSAQTGVAFYYYAQCTGDPTYRQRAENIVRNNLCLFFEDGKASCAYLYPYKINGIKAQLYDPYANDQDWALVSYLTVNDK
ncbi:MAG: six-hairpin glycosidase [Tannerella sp.]|jgi:hypothetical protein|nr:six-hairpin glycosidase [Tannerella sp.]